MAEESSSLLYLPQALEEEILVRLPVNSISRLVSVCKRWYFLFRSNAFNEFYFGHHQVSIPTKKDLRLIYPELRETRSVMWATGPLSNGIYALFSIAMKFDRCFFPQTLKITLFNPATRLLKFAAPISDEYLPRFTKISSYRCIVSCGIDDDYRVVVLIYYLDRGSCFLVFLYTWRTGEWELLIDYNPSQKKIGLLPGTDVFEGIVRVMDDMTACPRKLLNGCWHWMTFVEEQTENYGIRFMVLSFDFERKSFGLISGPRCITYHADIFVLQDHLAAIVVPEGCLCKPLLQIWMKMKDPETIWTNIYSVDHHILDAWEFYCPIFYGVDHYQVQEESELIRIKSVKLLIHGKLFTFDDKGGYQVAQEEEEEDSDQIPLSLAGISTFRPTLEPLPGSSKVLEHVGLNASILNIEGLHLVDDVTDDVQ